MAPDPKNKGRGQEDKVHLVPEVEEAKQVKGAKQTGKEKEQSWKSAGHLKHIVIEICLRLIVTFCSAMPRA